MEQERFTLTEQHVKLLRRMNVGWEGGTWGAPCIDSKRPYGNSDRERDMAEILGLELFEDADGEKHVTKEQRALMERLHLETQRALRVVLAAGSFEPGEYACDPWRDNWHRMEGEG